MHVHRVLCTVYMWMGVYVIWCMYELSLLGTLLL